LFDNATESGRADGQVLLHAARSLVRGGPSPFEVRVAQSTSTAQVVDVRVLPTDPKWLESNATAFRDSSTGLATVWLHVSVKENAGKPSEWQSVRQYPLYMNRYEAGQGWKYSVAVPERCTARAFLVVAG